MLTAIASATGVRFRAGFLSRTRAVMTEGTLLPETEKEQKTANQRGDGEGEDAHQHCVADGGIR